MKNKTHRIKGYTLAEMLIVVIILGVLLSLGTRTYTKERDRYHFNNGIIKMMELINTTRNFAVTSHPIYASPSSTVPIIPREGYGIYVVLDPPAGKPNIFVFGNTSVTGQNANKFDSEDIVIERYKIPMQIEFRSIYYNGIEQDDPSRAFNEIEAVILFKPPLADASLGNNIALNQNELKFKFFNRYAAIESPRNCQFIGINAIKAFPEISYNNCPL